MDIKNTQSLLPTTHDKGGQRTINMIKISTTLGDITVRLYDETPLHRDNFLKLVEEGYYNGTIFHRIIRDFMIQGGDPESRTPQAGAQYGTGGPGYTIPAEIQPDLIHKRGALAAARLGDEINPNRESSGSQFYIVWGQVYKEGQLGQLNKQLQQQAEQQVFNNLVQQHRQQVMTLRKNRDQEGLMELQNDLIAQTKAILQEKGNTGLTALQKETYKTTGGTPHLDGQYTVFGEVVEGLDIVEKIQSCQTGRGDRPQQDIFMNISVVE